MFEVLKMYFGNLKSLIWTEREDLDSYFKAEFKNNAMGAKDYFLCTQRLSFYE